MNKEKKREAQLKRAAKREKEEKKKQIANILGMVIPVVLIVAVVVVLVVAIVVSKKAGDSSSKGDVDSVSTEYTNSDTIDDTTDDSVDATTDDTVEDTNSDSTLNTEAGQVVEEGDTVNIDFTGYIDGEQFEGGSSDGAGYDLEIGSDSFIDGFEDGLIGHEVGENVTLDLAFPDDYWNSDYAGKATTFEVTINGIYQ